MVSMPDILEELQFSHFLGKDPITTSGSPRETLTWQYAGTSQPGDFSGGSFSGWTAFTTAEKVAFEATLTHIETFLNVDFVEVTGYSDPDLNVGQASIPGSTIGWGGNSISWSGTQIVRWDGFVLYDSYLDLSLDSQTNLLLHELGHALGLKHTFSTPGLPASEENNKYSVMSYSANPDNGQNSDAMMLYDVFALQDIWGAADYQTGNSSYTGSRTDTVDAVWDTGGTDLFDASAKTGAVLLDLREGAFSTFGSYPDVVITYGTEIENATGGKGNDTITGNDLANHLIGRGGDDTIKGGEKKDNIQGGDGNDSLIGQNGIDILQGGRGKDVLKGGNGNDNLKGNQGWDTLRGGNGDDTLNGQLGNDKLFGNQGADRFIFAKNGDMDIIRDFENDVDEIKFVGLGTTSEILIMATETDDGDVEFDFGDGDMLTVQNTTLAEISDDILT